jgi:hypothetical protein
MAMAIKTGLGSWLAVPYSLGFLLGCSFDTHPSLGRRDPAEPLVADGPLGEEARNQTSGTSGAAAGSSAADAGNAAGQASPGSSFDAGPLAPNVTTALDASSVLPALDATAPVRPTPPAPDAMVLRMCRAGSYTGDFSCAVDPTGVTPLTIMTRVTFTLTQAAPRDTTLAATASLAYDVAGIGFSGDLLGSLDCGSGVFHADLMNGMLTSVPVPVPFDLSGAVDGRLDDAGRTFAGTWSVTTTGGAVCQGPFTANLQP